MNTDYQYAVQKELNLDHDASLDHWASLLADQENDSRDSCRWEHDYENFYMQLDAGYNFDLYQP